MTGPANRGRSKAQVSLEFLVLAAAFLSFMGVWLSLILSVKGGMENGLSLSSLESTASDIREAADAACLMGEGSKRTVSLDAMQNQGAIVSLSGKKVTVSSGKLKVDRALRCPAKDASFSLRKSLILENTEGKIITRAS